MNVKNMLFRVLLILLVAHQSACTKLDLNEVGDVSYKPSLVLPIGSVNLNVSQLLTSIDTTFVKTDSASKMLYFEWIMPQDTLVAIDLNQYAQGSTLTKKYNIFEDIMSNLGISGVLPQIAVTLPAQTYSFDFKETYQFDYNQNIPGSKVYRIDSCRLSSATLNLNVNMVGVTLSETNYLDIELKFPSIIINDKPLTFGGKMTSQDLILSQEFYSFPLSFANSNNSIPMEVHLAMVSDGSAKITSDAAISLSTNFDFIGFEGVYGYFYQKDALYQNQFSVNIPSNSMLDKLAEGNKLLVHDPQLKFGLTSNVGIPVNMHLENVGVTDKNGNKVVADFNGSSTMTVRVKPSELSPTGEVLNSRTEVLLNRQNGATNKFFTVVPSAFNADFSIYSDDPDTNNVHFVIGEPHVYADARLLLPFVFDPGTEFGYDTIISVNFGGVAPSDTFKVEALNLYFDINNSLPIALDLSLDFLDSAGNLLFDGVPTRIEAAEVDAEGHAIAPSGQHLEVKCKGETIDKVLSASAIGMSVRVLGKDADSGIFLQYTDSLSVKMSAFVKAAVTMDLNNNNSSAK